MSKKSDLVSLLLEQVKPLHPVPEAPKAGISLLEQGVVLVLMRHMTQRQAEASLDSLRAAYEDWNEARVSQVQELAGHMRTSSRKKGVALLTDLTPAARALKAYLQDVYQITHGLDLEFLREDIPAGGKTIAQLSELGLTGGGYLLWLAGDLEFPVHIGLVRLFDRLDLIGRTTSMKKARIGIEPLIPEGRLLDFVIVFHEIVGRWNDPDEPIFMTVDALRKFPYGQKAYTDRVAHVKREAERRRKDEARQAAADKKERELQAREEEKARKRAEAESKRRSREVERRLKLEARKRMAIRKKAEAKKEVEAKKKAFIKKKADAKKKAEAKKKADAKKKVEAQKKAAAKKKADAKKADAKKATAKKTADAKKKAAAKKTAKKTAAKPAAKKKSAKKPAAKKKAPAKKKAAAKKKAPAKKKASAKKAPATKKAAAKASRRR